MKPSLSISALSSQAPISSATFPKLEGSTPSLFVVAYMVHAIILLFRTLLSSHCRTGDKFYVECSK